MKIKNEHCFYCNSGDIKTYKKINDYTLYKCETCGLVFTQKVDNKTDSVNKEWYSEEYIANYLTRRHDLKKRFAAKVRQIESMQRGGKLLDVGCGVGLFLESMLENSRYKWELYGLDINEKLLMLAKSILWRKGANFSLGTTTTAKIKNKDFDCITCFDVLEHDTQIKFTLDAIKNLLKPSGLLVVQAPNYSSLMARLCSEKWDWWAVPDHVFHFNPYSLSSILKDRGFRIRKIYTWDPPQEFISNIQGAIKSRLGSVRFIDKLISKLLYTPLLLLWFLLVFLERKFNIGSLIVVFAES